MSPGRAPLKNRLPSTSYWATFVESLAGLIFSNLRPLRSVIATSHVDAVRRLPRQLPTGGPFLTQGRQQRVRGLDPQVPINRSTNIPRRAIDDSDAIFHLHKENSRASMLHGCLCYN